MEMQESLWNGYKRLDFVFEGQEAILILPDVPTEDKRWLFKTEYFGAFPGFEVEMLGKGYYVAHVKNTTRWGAPEVTQRQARFAEFLHTEFGLHKKFVTVGMSCGGMQAIYLAAEIPERIALCYVDAPVMNLLSCPFYVGLRDKEPPRNFKETNYKMMEEFIKYRGMTLVDLLSYRHHPIDCVPKLIEAGIPVFLVCGDSDGVVFYEENGAQLYKMYTEANAPIQLILKPGCDHHPHGLEDNTPLIEAVEKSYQQ